MRWTLIVDDDGTHGRMLVEGLCEAGWRAEAASSLTNALPLIGSGRYGAVVGEARMPDGDGFALLHEARTSAPPVPVILMSSYGADLTQRQAIAAGAFAYLPKPFALSDLLRLVSRAHARLLARL